MSAALVVAVVGSLATPAAAGRGDEPRLGFADGEWIGDFVAGLGISVAEATGRSDGGGAFSLRVEGGSITGGSYDYTATGEVAGPSGSAVGGLEATGTITGAADEPILELDTAQLSATITVNGITRPFEQTVSGGSMTMTILSATCSVVIGTVDPEITAAIAPSGVGITSLSSRFVARRAPAGGADRDEEFDVEVVSLITAGDDLVAAAAGGMLDVTAFLDLLLRAERLAETIPRNAGCGIGSRSDHLSVVAHVVADLLRLIVDNPDAFGATELQVALEAALRAGTFESTIGGDELRGDIRDVLGAELDAAIAAGDDVAVSRLAAAAQMMGWEAEAGDAADHLDESLRGASAAGGDGGGAVPAVLDGDAGPVADAALPARVGTGAEPTDPAFDPLDLPDVERIRARARDGARPRFRWPAVDGAETYVVVVQNLRGNPSWAWRGPERRVFLGGITKPPNDAAGPVLTRPAQWQVVAYGADGSIVGASRWSVVSPG